MENLIDETGLTAEGLDLLLEDPESGIKEFRVSDYLNDPDSIAAYLTQVLRDGDDGLIAAALGEACRSTGMTKVAEQTGIGREALYKALQEGAKPRLNTVNRVVRALGMRLVVVKDGPVTVGRGTFKHADTVAPSTAGYHMEAAQ